MAGRRASAAEMESRRSPIKVSPSNLTALKVNGMSKTMAHPLADVAEQKTSMSRHNIRLVAGVSVTRATAALAHALPPLATCQVKMSTTTSCCRRSLAASPTLHLGEVANAGLRNR